MSNHPPPLSSTSFTPRPVTKVHPLNSTSMSRNCFGVSSLTYGGESELSNIHCEKSPNPIKVFEYTEDPYTRPVPSGFRTFSCPALVDFAQSLNGRSPTLSVDSCREARTYVTPYFSNTQCHTQSDESLKNLGRAWGTTIKSVIINKKMLKLAQHIDKHELGVQVLGVNLYGTATLTLKRGNEVYEVRLRHGDCYIMEAESRYEWSHGISNATEQRVSVTIRTASMVKFEWKRAPIKIVFDSSTPPRDPGEDWKTYVTRIGKVPQQPRPELMFYWGQPGPTQVSDDELAQPSEVRKIEITPPVECEKVEEAFMDAETAQSLLMGTKNEAKERRSQSNFQRPIESAQTPLALQGGGLQGQDVNCEWTTDPVQSIVQSDLWDANYRGASNHLRNNSTGDGVTAPHQGPEFEKGLVASPEGDAPMADGLDNLVGAHGNETWFKGSTPAAREEEIDLAMPPDPTSMCEKTGNGEQQSGVVQITPHYGEAQRIEALATIRRSAEGLLAEFSEKRGGLDEAQGFLVRTWRQSLEHYDRELEAIQMSDTIELLKKIATTSDPQGLQTIFKDYNEQADREAKQRVRDEKPEEGEKW